jgi:hypothetical protein
MAYTEKQTFRERNGAGEGANSVVTPMHRLDADGFPLPSGDMMTTPPSARRRRASRPADLELTPSSGPSYTIPVSSSSPSSTSTPRTTRSSIGKGLPSDLKGSVMRSGADQEERDERREHRRVVTDSVQPVRETTEHDDFLSRMDAPTSSSRAVSYGYQQRDQHRPLPAPPSTSAISNDLHLPSNPGVQPSSSSRSLLHPRTPARTHGTTTTRHDSSVDARGVMISGSSSSSLFSPTTPGQPDPRRLDRAGLIGVGELATTPRFTTHSYTNWKGGEGTERSTMNAVDGGEVRTSRSEARNDDPYWTSERTAVPPSRSLDVVTPGSRRDRQVSGPRVRTSGATSTQQIPHSQRVGGEETRMRSQRATGVPRLPSFGDLGGSFKVPTPTSAATPSTSSSRSSSPPFAVRPLQHRQPPPSTSTIPSSTTPPTPSAQSILRQFGSTRDFSHLPPSPSSASIGKIMMKESASMGNLPVMASGSGDGGAYSTSRIKEWRTPSSAGSPRKGSKGVSAVGTGAEGTSQLDEETREVIRRLDGLGKSSSGSLKRVQGYGLDAVSDHDKSGSGCKSLVTIARRG